MPKTAKNGKIRDAVRPIAPEPEILRIIGEESVAKGTDKLTSDEINEIIREARAARKTKRK